MSSVRSQHLDNSDRKPLCLTKWVQRGQQRDHGTGTRLRADACLTELDPRNYSIRSGEIFHWREGATLWETCLVLKQCAQVISERNPCRHPSRPHNPQLDALKYPGGPSSLSVCAGHVHPHPRRVQREEAGTSVSSVLGP